MFVSIVGDSISTFEGYNPDGYKVFYNKTMQMANGLNSVYDTWWAKVNQSLHAYLCVNNSYSGSKVTGNTFPSACSAQRLNFLHNGDMYPDLIVIYIGFNDFGNGVNVRPKGLKALSRKDLSFFINAYEKMIFQIKQNYPNGKIVCGTLMRTFIPTNDSWIFPEYFRGVSFEDYNDAIREASRRQKCCLADTGALNMRYETLDGSHPTVAGHRTLADAWRRCLVSIGLV